MTRRTSKLHVYADPRDVSRRWDSRRRVDVVIGFVVGSVVGAMIWQWLVQ